ncbi:MAG: histidine kinase [Caldilineaceae bacterium]
MPILRDGLDTFRPLALNIKMAVLPFDEGAIFAEDTSPTTTPRTTTPCTMTPRTVAAQYRSEAAGLTQLLSVHERVVVEQSERIAQVVAELEAQIAENERLRKLATEAAVAEERTRLSRDLHDSVTQALYSQTLYAEAAVRQLQSGRTERAADHLQQLKETALQALREMRLLIFELRPAALEEEGLVSAAYAPGIGGIAHRHRRPRDRRRIVRAAGAPFRRRRNRSLLDRAGGA